MQRKYHPVRVALLLSVVGILSSCTDASEDLSAPIDSSLRADLADNPVPPESPSAAVHLSGRVRSSIWQARGRGLAFLGTINSHPDVTLAGKNVIADGGLTTLATFPGISTDSLGLTISPSMTSDGLGLVNVLASAGGRGNALRIALAGPTFSHTMSNGQELRMEFSAPKNGRPPGVMALYVGDELKAFNFFTHTRRGSRWTVVDMTIVHFDSTGLASITKHDLEGVVGQPMSMNGRPLSVASTGMQALSIDCDSQIIPTPECEEASEDGPCLSQKLALAAAGAAFVSAEIAYAAALAACATGVLCPGVGVAVAALSAAGLALVAAEVAFNECIAATGAGGGGGNPGGGDTNCETYIIEVSDDGGITWEYLTTVRVCG